MEATILTPVKCLGPITTCLKDRYGLPSSSFSSIRPSLCVWAWAFD